MCVKNGMHNKIDKFITCQLWLNNKLLIYYYLFVMSFGKDNIFQGISYHDYF